MDDLSILNPQKRGIGYKRLLCSKVFVKKTGMPKSPKAQNTHHRKKTKAPGVTEAIKKQAPMRAAAGSEADASITLLRCHLI